MALTTATRAGSIVHVDGEIRRRVVAGTVLIVVGGGFLVLQLLEGASRAGWLLFLGALFIVGHIYRGTYGFLVAGGILVGVGLGQLGEEILDVGSGIGSIGLGLGFISIYSIDRFNRPEAPWWPLIPGGILLVAGAADLGAPFADGIDYVWPAVLIILGLSVLFGMRSKRQND